MLRREFPNWLALVEKRMLMPVRSLYSEHAFGNAAVELRGAGLDIRLVKDRGDFSVEIGRSGRWYDQRIIGDFMRAEGYAPALAPANTQIEALERDWPAIVDLINDRRGWRRFEKSVARQEEEPIRRLRSGHDSP